MDAVIAVHGALIAEGDALVGDFDLTAARWLILGALQDGPVTVAGIARRRGLRRQSVRESAARLERDHLVRRSANPADRRAPLLALTEQGRQALAAIEPRRTAWAAELTSVLNPAGLATTLATLTHLRHHLACRQSPARQ